MGLVSEAQRLLSVTQLQQKAKALETEVAEHMRLRQELELHVQARTTELQSKNVQLLDEIKRREKLTRFPMISRHFGTLPPPRSSPCGQPAFSTVRVLPTYTPYSSLQYPPDVHTPVGWLR
jgi:hypothetical protein